MVNMKAVLFFVLLAVTLIVMWPQQSHEKYEAQAQGGDPGPGKNVTVVTPDELDQVIRATQVALSKKIGKCSYCIETTNINLSGNVYSGRFLFTVLPEEGGGAYGVSVDSRVNKDNWDVLDISLQSLNTIDAMDPYNQFKSGRDIEEANLPKLADLQSALSNM
jgi:hypothetical protein